MKKYYFEIQLENKKKSEVHWTKDTTRDNARDTMWSRYKNAVTITFLKEE